MIYKVAKLALGCRRLNPCHIRQFYTKSLFTNAREHCIPCHAVVLQATGTRSTAAQCRNVTTTGFLLNTGNKGGQQQKHRPTLSYIHKVDRRPLMGKTIGEFLDETTEKFPDREAVIFCRDGKRLTFAELRNKVDNFAAGLLSLGIQHGDRVGIWAPNVLEWVITQYATARIGAILVNINPAYRTDELEYALKKVSCKAIVSAETFKTQNYYHMLADICPELESAEPGHLESKRLPDLRCVIMIGDRTHPGTFKSGDVFNMGTSEHREMIEKLKKTIQFDEPINIQFTSGTTGFPKGATLTHHNMVNNCYFSGDALGYTEAYHRICIPVPLYHCFGMAIGCLSAIVHACTAVFPAPSFEPEATLKAVNDERLTSQYGTPTMFIDMLHHPKFADYDLTSLRTGVMGGSPCPIETMKQVIDKMHMKQVTIIYGLTETSPVVFQSDRDDSVERRVSTVGQVAPHTEVKVIDPGTGQILPINTPGELCSRGYSTMLGYWGDEEKTRKAVDRNGWFHSGDIALIDEHGYGRVVGRIKDMIIRGGENIYPTEIEQFLYRHPKVEDVQDMIIRGGENIYPTEIEQFLYRHLKVEDVQVIGVPDSRLGEVVCAWIRLKAGQEATPDEIKEFCKGKIAHFKIPKLIHFVSEFPLTVTGKVKKFKMREEMVKIMETK